MAPPRSTLHPGVTVRIVTKADQRTGRLTTGIVARILTKSRTHPHGIKVQLTDGTVGRVKQIVAAEEEVRLAMEQEGLTRLKCVACRGDEPQATEHEIAVWHPQVPDWEIVERDGVRRLERTFKFKNFAETLTFVNRVGEAAEMEGHHPLIEFTWGRATIQWWTHKIGGLHRNDFIMAAKTDEVAG